MCEHELQISGEDYIVCKKCFKVWASKETRSPNYIPMPYPVYPQNPYPIYPQPIWTGTPIITCQTGTAT